MPGFLRAMGAGEWSKHLQLNRLFGPWPYRNKAGDFMLQRNPLTNTLHKKRRP
jgi:hypothetical protein